MASIHQFIETLNLRIDEEFPKTERYMIKGGDYIKDVILELRQDEKSLRYSPHELYENSKDYEETIEIMVRKWKAILNEE